MLLGIASGRTITVTPGEAVLQAASAILGLLQLAVSIGYFKGRDGHGRSVLSFTLATHSSYFSSLYFHLPMPASLTY